MVVKAIEDGVPAMMIAIQSRDFPLTNALNNHVHKRLGFTLGRAAGQVRRIAVRLSDLNGPRGGIDKRCFIEVRLDRMAPVVVEDVQSDLYTAIDRAASRIGRAVIRRLAQDSNRRRQRRGQDLHRWNPGL
jgi:ribosome-associated translation inhibitor RaiA